VDRVVAVGDGVHDRLLPGERRVLGHVLEEQVAQPRRALDQRFEQRSDLGQGDRQVALDAWNS
jgi:hypothetical protein